jgi:hypothetical protein
MVSAQRAPFVRDAGAIAGFIGDGTDCVCGMANANAAGSPNCERPAWRGFITFSRSRMSKKQIPDRRCPALEMAPKEHSIR